MAGAVRSFAVAMAVSLAAMTSAWAQDSNQDLKKEVDELKKKVAALESTEKASPAPVAISAGAKESENLMDDLNKWMKEVKLSGFVDSGYTFNFARPDNRLNGNTGLPAPYATIPPTTGSSVRAFDKQSNAFVLNNAQLTLEKAATDKSIAGFKMDISMGKDADVFGAAGSGLGDNFDIQEGYVTVLAPIGRGISFSLGKFATLAGAEVIESKDDMNYSRSLMFFYAIPFTHTGIRANYSVTDQVDVTLGINNGWDTLTDNNDSKTLEFEVNYKPNDMLKFTGNMYWGAEKNPVAGPNGPTQPGDKRFLVDFVAQLTIDKFSAVLNWDYGSEKDSFTSGSGKLKKAEWTGMALYAKYQLQPWYAPILRAEYFRDGQAYRTGTKQTLEEFTFTNQFDLAGNLILRAEIRLDKSSEDVFLNHERSKGSETTFGLEAIVYF